MSHYTVSMAQAIATLLPVFIVIAVGYVLRVFEWVTDSTFKGMNWLVYWVGLPALLVIKIGSASLSFDEARHIILLNIVGVAACLIVSYGLALVLGMRWSRVGTFAQAGFRGNLAFLALPVIIFAFEERPELVLPEHAEAMVLLALGPVIVLYNFVAVLALVASSEKAGGGGAAVSAMFIKTVTNPLILACLAGVLLSLSGWTLPLPAVRTLEMLGQFSLPLALVCVGGSLAATKLGGHVFVALLSSAVKLAVAPLAGYAAALWLGVERDQLLIAMMMLAAPTAVASYVLADQLDGDSGLASSAVVLSSLLAPLSFGAVIWLMM